MGNEMGNNNTSGVKEEENTKDEALGKSLQDAAREDDTKGENEIIIQNEAADIQKQYANPANSNPTGTENTLVVDTISSGKEPIDVSTIIEASENGKVEDSVRDDPNGRSAVQYNNLESQGIMKPSAEKDFPDVSKLGDVPSTPKATDDEGAVESVNTPSEDLEPKVHADGKSDQLDPTMNSHETSFQGEGAIESSNEGKEASGETLSSEELGDILKTPTSGNMIDSHVSDSTIDFSHKTNTSIGEEFGQHETKTSSEDNYGSNVMNPENMQETGPLVHIDGNNPEISSRMILDDCSSADRDEEKENLIPRIDHSEVTRDDQLVVGSNDGQDATSDSPDVVEESTGETLILNDSSSQLTVTLPYEQPCPTKEVAVQPGDKVIILEQETESTVRKSLEDEGREFQSGEDEPVGGLCNDSLSVLGDACEINKNEIAGDTREMNDKEMAGDSPCDYQSDKEYEVKEAKVKENGLLVSTSLCTEAFEEKTQKANLHEEFLESNETKVAKKELVLVDSTQAEQKAGEEKIAEKTESGQIPLSSAFACSENTMLEVKEATVTEVKEIKACENGEGNKFPGTTSDNIGKTNNVSLRRQKSPSFDFGLARTEESDQTPLLYKASVESPVQERGFTGLERCDSKKPKPPFMGYLKEEKGVVRQEKDEDNNEGERTNISKNDDKSDSSKGKEKRKHRSFLFGNCMCCATVLN